MAERAKHLYGFGPFQLDPAQRLLFRDGEVVPLTLKALETLIVLVENHGKLITKDELLERVWTDTFVEEVTLAKNISTLRKVLGGRLEGGEYIETHAKRGYRFVAAVRELDREESARADPGGIPSEPGAIPLRRGENTQRILLLGLTAAILLLSAGVWYRTSMKSVSPARRVMLAVLPFENLSGDPEQEYFSNGLTEEMITQLGRLEPGRLGVIARTSAMQYKATHKDTHQIGSELGVDYLLEGSVRREGSRVRITAQLIEARDQSHLWAEDYDRDLRDILNLQSEVTAAIAQQIRLKLTPEEHARLSRAAAVNPETYENYLKGRYFWNKRTVEGHQKAIEFFEKAIALDATYAQAYAGLADAYALLGSGQNSVLPRREAMTRARQAAQKALSLDESLADAHASLGFVEMHYDWDFAGAEKEYLRAIALNPGYATAHHWYAYDLVALGRMEDAVAQIRLAEKADPLSVIISRDVGEILLFAGRDDEAIAQCRKTLEMDPHFGFAHLELAWAYQHRGMQKEFVAELGKPEVSESIPGVLYAITGKKAQTRRVLAELLRAAPKSYGSSINLVQLYGYLGELDHAFAWLEKCVESRDGGLIIMRVDPTLAPLRSDPRFEQVARRVGVRPDKPSR